MEDSIKDGYIAGAIFLLLGIILIVSAFEQGIFTSGKITGIFGVFSSLAGIGSFLNPKIAEVLVHYIKGQQKGSTISQNQNKPKNSPQIGNINGPVTINYEKKMKDIPDSPRIEYKIASILPGTVEYDLIKSGQVWFWIKNNDDKKYKVYIEIEFISEKYRKKETEGYYGGKKEWNLNAFTGVHAPGIVIPKEVVDLAKRGKNIEVKIDCTVKDENNNFVEKKLPVSYIYNKNTGWFFEP
jgi:hypothetical protein